MSDALYEAALRYHRADPPGKLAVTATKPVTTQHDLAMAYSPGVAAACEEIAKDPQEAATVTGRANLVGVITNGTAVLGLGAIGALAAKPVMEGKAVLFKKFAGINVFDIEIDETDPDKFVDIVAGLEPTFGGINLEDIKAPACFAIEAALRSRLNIPVFHDDQHGTAIIAGTAIISWLRLIDGDLGQVKLVTSGAGAAAIACLDLLVSMGMPRENITLCDSRGVVYTGRNDGMDPYKEAFARDTTARTLEDAIVDANVFLGVSAPGVLTGPMVEKMAPRPLVLALANPDPEILPEDARRARPDAIVATGRSDYPNQVNNVLCFPFIFRGALDVGATSINEEMKIACVHALSDLATAPPSDVVTEVYGAETLKFGPEYLIPKPFDPRLITEVAPAVAEAAMKSGVATRPIEDLNAYRQRLTQFVFRSGHDMKPIFEAARREPQRVAFAEGEERRVLQAVHQVIDQGIAIPILVGRPAVIESRLNELSLPLRIGKDFEVVNPHEDDRYFEYWSEYHRLMGRMGRSPEASKIEVRTNTTVIAALMVHRGEADALLCGTDGRFRRHLQTVSDVIGTVNGVSEFSTLTMHIMPARTFFICDTHVTHDPSAEDLAEMAILSAREIRRFGITPKVAFLSRSNFGTHHTKSARKMRKAAEILASRAPEIESDGEMNADAALSERVRGLALPDSRLTGQANLLVLPNVDAANIASNLMKSVVNGVTVGPILLGARSPAHIVNQSVTVRGLLNMTALSVAQAQRSPHESQEKSE